jgi:hypothetical protein
VQVKVQVQVQVQVQMQVQMYNKCPAEDAMSTFNLDDPTTIRRSDDEEQKTKRTPGDMECGV